MLEMGNCPNCGSDNVVVYFDNRGIMGLCRKCGILGACSEIG